MIDVSYICINPLVYLPVNSICFMLFVMLSSRDIIIIIELYITPERKAEDNKTLSTNRKQQTQGQKIKMRRIQITINVNKQ